ncbi:MAG: PRC-barrel domain-containing protein [Caldicoprobacterales bacterium]|jgi:uncharacterized protein YrrD|nr:hypothetical protein [Clostridiales bacterium]
MKKAHDIVGLPLISVEEAKELGQIREILIDPLEASVKYLMVMDDKWYFGAKIIPFDKVLSIGQDAITIRKADDLIMLSQVQDAIELAEKDIKIIGARVFTEKGENLGMVLEYYVNQDNGKILRYDLEGVNGPIIMDNPKIVSFGTNTLVIKDAMIEQEENKPQYISSAKLFEEKQRQFLIGRRAKKTILDNSGNVLVEEGQAITREILDKVTDKNKIIEITINTV